MGPSDSAPLPTSGDRTEQFSTAETPPGVARHRGNSFRQGFVWTLAGNAVFALSQWLVLIVLARLGSAAIAGQYSLALAITGPVILLAGLQLRGIQATDATRAFSFHEYRLLRLLMLAVAAIALGVFLLLSPMSRDIKWVIVLVCLAKIVESLSDLRYGLLQQLDRMRAIGMSLILRGIGSVLAVGGAMLVLGSVRAALAALTVAWATVLLFHDSRQPCDTPSAIRVPSSSRPNRLLKLLTLALPLGAVTALLSLTTNIPRYFISDAVGDAALGVFAAVSYLMVAGNLFVGALTQTASSRLASMFAAGDREAFLRLTGRLLIIALALGAGGILISALLGPELLRLLYGDGFDAYGDLLLWFAVIATLSYCGSVLGVAVTATRRFGIQLPIHICSAIAVLVLSAALVPRLSLTGAAIAVLGSTCVGLAGYAIVLMNAASRHEARTC